jgi:TfoX/Sxy family transcriptional regulator of competence genes
MARHRPEVPMSMPHFRKSPPELVERFTTVTAALPDVERRQMFGYPCVFVGGNMVTGLHQAAWFVRLAEADRDELLRLPGAGPFEPMPGRPMGGYVVLPAGVIADDAAVQAWVELAIGFGRSLPAKTPRTARAPRRP